MVEKHRQSIEHRIFSRAENHDLSGKDDIYMLFAPTLMTAAWSDEALDNPQISVPFFVSVEHSNLPEHLQNMHGNARRMGLLDVSEVVRLIHAAARNLPSRSDGDHDLTPEDDPKA